MKGLWSSTTSMSLSVLLLTTVVPFVVLSQHVQIPEYGACFNKEQWEQGANLRECLHCHFDSSECKNGEEYLNAFDIKEKGENKWHGCTCDERMYTNVYVKTCYDAVKTSSIICSTSGNCPTNDPDYDFGNRLNKEDYVPPETCKDGAKAYGPAFDSTRQTSCGKRCQCNSAFKSGQRIIVAGDTSYGVCKNIDTEDEYCAIKKKFCTPGETFVEHWDSDKECTCLNTPTGACLDDATTFSHCAISADDCKDGQQFMLAGELRSPSSPLNVKCRLCQNTWEDTDTPTGAPTKVSSVTPSISPTTKPCADRSKNDCTSNAKCVWENKKNKLVECNPKVYKKCATLNKKQCKKKKGVCDYIIDIDECKSRCDVYDGNKKQCKKLKNKGKKMCKVKEQKNPCFKKCCDNPKIPATESPTTSPSVSPSTSDSPSTSPTASPTPSPTTSPNSSSQIDFI